jgi:hypothetical protein
MLGCRVYQRVWWGDAHGTVIVVHGTILVFFFFFFFFFFCFVLWLVYIFHIRFYDLSPLTRFCFFKNLLLILEQLIYDLAFKLTTPCLWSCIRPSILPNHLKFVVTDMLINKLFYFKSRIVIVEWNRSYADLPHMPQLVYMRHIAMASQLKRLANNHLGSGYDPPGYPSMTVGAPGMLQ